MTSGQFEIWDVSSWDAVNQEPIGREEKLWVREPGASSRSRERDWLFKPVIIKSGHRQGEDWAEKIVSELGGLMGVPCAEIRFAVRDGRPGSLSRNVAPDEWNLVSGSILLSELIENYQEGRLSPPGRPGHSPKTVCQALSSCEPAPGVAGLGAFEVFAGYLELDAWVANRDRHDENWAVLVTTALPERRCRLAASFDHASSLGFGERDHTRAQLLQSGKISSWARKGTAVRFEHDPSSPKSDIPSLVTTADLALALAGARARAHWMQRLAAVSREEIQNLILRTPNLSDVTASFILELLTINRERLLDECG